jgi:hypothetical protein
MKGRGIGIASSALGSAASRIVHHGGSHGISAGQASMIANNTRSVSGRAGTGEGIYANLYWVRIEGNNCVDGDCGIWVTRSKSIHVRTACKFNTDYFQT